MLTETKTYATPMIRIRREANIDRLLQKLVREYPRASEEDLTLLVLKHATREEQEAIVHHWVHLRLKAILRYDDELSAEAFISKIKERGRKRKRLSKAAEEAAPLIFLELVMPNGKALANCTFHEVGAFGTAYQRLSQMGKPRQKVGILTEKQVRDALSP